MTLLDGKRIANDIKTEIKNEVMTMQAEGKPTPHLVAIIVGHDGASETYVANKEKACTQVGFKSTIMRFEDNITEAQLLQHIKKLNNDTQVDGFIVQLPLPQHIDSDKVLAAIAPEKDVDGFHPTNVGRMVTGLPAYISATPYGIVQLLQRYNITTDGKHCVVLGRSNIVGRPIANLLSQKNNPGNCTVTICHSHTNNLKNITRTADILIVALGAPQFVTADMVKKGAVVVDVGITRVPSNETKNGWKLLGDVKFDEVAPLCSYITPVPGGVGPLTIVSLLKNTLKAAKHEVYK